MTESAVGRSRIPAYWKHVKEIVPCDMGGKRSPRQWREDVVSLFFNEKSGTGIWHYAYEVERMADDSALYLTRATWKLGMDYVVVYKDATGAPTGPTFPELEADLALKKRNDPSLYDSLVFAAEEVQSGGDPDAAMHQYPELTHVRWVGIPVENLLKIMKWVFIDEDIKYWHQEGRQKWTWKRNVDNLVP